MDDSLLKGSGFACHASTISVFDGVVKYIYTVFLILISSDLFADGLVTTCPNGTLKHYLDLGPDGCILGDEQFSGFQEFLGTNPIRNISMTVIDTAFNPGFVFDFGKAKFLSGASVFSTVIRYDITVLVERLWINNMSFSIDATGAAIALTDTHCGTETGLCHSTNGGMDGLALCGVGIGSCGLPPSGSFSFPGAKRLFVQDEFVAIAGLGDLTLSTVTQQFHETTQPPPPPPLPEPTSILLLGSALLGLGLLVNGCRALGEQREDK